MSKKPKQSKANADRIDDPNHLEWAMKSFWSVEEAAALMLDCDPRYVLQESEGVIRAFTKAKQIIVQAQEQQQLPSLMRPRVFLDWLERSHGLGMHPLLKKFIIDYEHSPDNGLSLLKEENADLFQELQTANYQLKNSKPIGTRERETLLIIIYAMAHTKYGFASGKMREDAASDIRDDVLALGRTLSDDTIRNWLKEAKEAFTETSRLTPENG